MCVLVEIAFCGKTIIARWVAHRTRNFAAPHQQFFHFMGIIGQLQKKTKRAARPYTLTGAAEHAMWSFFFCLVRVQILILISFYVQQSLCCVYRNVLKRRTALQHYRILNYFIKCSVCIKGFNLGHYCACGMKVEIGNIWLKFESLLMPNDCANIATWRVNQLRNERNHDLRWVQWCWNACCCSSSLATVLSINFLEDTGVYF